MKDEATVNKSNIKFMDRYHNDPEYRKKHINKMCEKIECDCGSIISRSNMTNHKRSGKHQQWVDENTKIKCDCGKNYRKKNVVKHNKSKNHMNWVESESVNSRLPPTPLEILSWLHFVPFKALKTYLKEHNLLDSLLD